MADFLPREDSDLIAWTTNFLAYISNDPGNVGLTTADVVSVADPATAFSGDFDANVTAQAAAQSAAQQKDTSRAASEAAIRVVVRKLQANPTLTNAQRQAMGISLRTNTRTPVEVPTTRPRLDIDTSQRLRHTVSFADESTPTSKAKPAGVMGCEIWVKIGGAPPVDPSECQFLGLDTRTPYIATYHGEDAGKIAHYMARWVNTRSQPGPWSETASATVGA